MKYSFNLDESSIIDRILEINNVDFSDLDVSNFVVDKNIDVVDNFKEKLLSKKDKRFLIVGDYDCDGICATAIISKLLTDLDIKSNYYIPSRSKEGYGINNNIVDMANNNNFEAIILVDNGIIASEQLKKCKELGISVFIIDHHEYNIEPECEAYLHPNLFIDKYKDMCAAGISALLSNSIRNDDFSTCLGGLATLADMVSVFNYNRYLLKQMIDILDRSEILPIKLLLGDNKVTFDNLHYNVIPKINAVSRLDNMMNVNYVVKFLLADENEAIKYFDKIEIINKARKEYTKQMFDLADSLVDNRKNIIVIKHDDFKEGLCGLVANRILAQANKPVLIFANVDGQLKGSGRAPIGTNFYDYLSQCKNLFSSFGGHAAAVGLSMEIDRYDEFIEYIDSHPIEYNEQVKDVIVLTKGQINLELVNDIESLQPFGIDFVEPLIGLNNDYESRHVVANKYPKFIINDLLSAISFNTKLMNQSFDYMVGKLKNDDYNKGKLSLIIEDLV